MRARRIIDGAAFGPEVLKVVREAFDQAWLSIADKFAANEHETAREVLALAMMSATRDDSRDVAVLREVGIRAMQRKYPTRFAGPSGQGSQIG